MRYWWVNQNQTFRHELAGGYLWSPTRTKRGTRFFESMQKISFGDAIFSFVDRWIVAMGIEQAYCWEARGRRSSVEAEPRRREYPRNVEAAPCDVSSESCLLEVSSMQVSCAPPISRPPSGG